MKVLLDENFRFGFELEYQNSKLGEKLCEVIKQERINSRYRGMMNNNSPASVYSNYQFVYHKLVELYSKEYEINYVLAKVLHMLSENGYTPTPDDIAHKFLQFVSMQQLVNFYPEMEAIIKDAIGTYSIRQYEYTIKDLQLHPALERVNDGSVDGGEIRPIHKQTLENSIALLQSLEKSYDFRKDMRVDIECSFHIHISNTGIKHSYGENFQRYMYEYLYNNMDKLSNNILQRFLHVQDNDNNDEDEDDEGATDWCNEYYALEISTDRYNAIAFRESLGTWEFRFFGNISNANEGILCLNFAKDCYMYAYNKVHIDGKKCNFERVCSSIKGRARELTGIEDREVGTLIEQPSIFTYVDEPAELPPETLAEVINGVLSPRILMPEGVVLDERIDYRLLEPRSYQSTSLCEALGLVQANTPTNTQTATLDEAMNLFPANAPDLPQPRELVAMSAEELQREFYRIIMENNNDRTGT